MRKLDYFTRFKNNIFMGNYLCLGYFFVSLTTKPKLCNIVLKPTFYQDPRFYINMSLVKISSLVTFITMMVMLRRKRKRRRDEDNIEEVEGERAETPCVFFR